MEEKENVNPKKIITDLQNKVLTLLIGECYHEPIPQKEQYIDDRGNLYICSICNEYFRDFPNFYLPEWKIKLQQWLSKKENEDFLAKFCSWAKFWFSRTEYLDDVHLIQKLFMDDNFPIAMTNFLEKVEIRKIHGWKTCPKCVGNGTQDWVLLSGNNYQVVCINCNGVGRIKKDWNKIIDSYVFTNIYITRNGLIFSNDGKTLKCTSQKELNCNSNCRFFKPSVLNNKQIVKLCDGNTYEIINNGKGD